MTESSGQGRIPVLDIGAYLAGEARAPRRWRVPSPAPAKTPDFSSSPITACRSNSGRRDLRRRPAILARPEGDKLTLKVGKYNIGYLPFGGQSCDTRRSTRTPAELQRELLHHPRPRPDHPDIVNNKPLVGLNRWPEDMTESAPRRPHIIGQWRR